MKKRIIFLFIVVLLSFAVGCGSAVTDNVPDSGTDAETTAPPEDYIAPRNDVVLELMNMTEGISVTGKSFYPDYNTLSEKLMCLRYGIENGILTEENFPGEYESAVRELTQLGFYYDYFEKTYITADDGTVYGANAGESGPIGGGMGYANAFIGNPFDHFVVDDNDFYHVMSIAKAGDVIYIPEAAVIDLSDMYLTNFPELIIPEGVTIVSTRGNDAMKGAILRFSSESAKMFSVSSNVRISGVVIEGSDADAHNGEESYTLSNGIELKGTGIEIENCEISGFSGAGIIVTEGDAYIHHCYIHHVRGNGNGNGVLVNGGSAKLETNLFSNCRNGVSVKGNASIEASNNVEVGNSIESLFYIDSGASAVLKNNTVLGYTQPVILDGVPAEYTAENNLFSLNYTQYSTETFRGTSAVREVSAFRNNVFNIKEPYIVSWGETESSDTVLTGITPEEHPAVPVDYGYEYVPDILTVGGVGDNNKVMETLEKAGTYFSSGNSKKSFELMTDTVSEFGGFSAYYTKEHSYEIDGVIYGAYVAEDEDPIGGGVGYSEIFTTGDYVVDTLDELVDALGKAKGGETVYIEGDAVIDVTSVKTLTLGEGVTLASNRGYMDENGNYSTGAVIFSSTAEISPVIKAKDGSRISGIVLNGKNTGVHLSHNDRDKYWPEITYYSLSIVNKDGIVAGNDMRIDNCELLGFGHAAIHIYPDIKGVKVDHCYIHHNRTTGLGYGICHNDRAESVIEYCQFNFNRHSIAGTGAPGTGYIARFNIEMGDAEGHNFDMHGGEDRGDGTDIAGTYCEMYNNTFLCRYADPYVLRGIPEDYQLFYHNVVVGKRDNYNDAKLIDERVSVYDNVFAGILTEN